MPGAQGSLQWSNIRHEYDGLMVAEANAGATIDQTSVDFESIVSGTNSISKSLDGVQAYTNRLSATLSVFPSGHGFINGKHFAFDEVFDHRLRLRLLISH